MPKEQISPLVDSTAAEVDRTPSASARLTGWSLLCAAVATAAAVIARVASVTDQPTLAESLAAIAESSGLYFAAGIGRLISGIALVASAWFLSKTGAMGERRTPWAAAMFALSGLFTILSGASALVLAVGGREVNSTVETAAFLRLTTGKLGFMAAGLALFVAARRQWELGGGFRLTAPLSAVTGLSMQFIWMDAATFMHRISGTAFLLWLLAGGAVLVSGRAERRFRAFPVGRPMPILERMKEAWGVGLRGTLAILLAFSLAGLTTVWLKGPVIEFLFPATVPGWLQWTIYLIIMLPLYQLLLLGYGTLLGQFDFFWNKLKAVGRLFRGRVERPSV